MILAQALTGLVFLIFAADFSAIHGSWAHELGIPFSGFARYSCWLVPLVALLPCVLPRRIASWFRVVVCDLLLLAVVLFPGALFSLGTHSVLVPGQQNSQLMEQLRAELGFPVVIIHEGDSSRIFVSRSHDSSLMRDALHRLSVQPNASP